MNIFISWSGATCRKAAEALKEWLPSVVQSVKPFVSSQDIVKGSRSLEVLGTELEGSSFGIVCVSKSTQDAPWINFEAGALARFLTGSRVVPFLLDLRDAELVGPLAQFQAVNSQSREDVLKLMYAINDFADPPAPRGVLERSFAVFWEDLNTRLDEVRRLLTALAGSNVAESGAESSGQSQSRTDRQLLEEVLVLLREEKRGRIGTLTGDQASHSSSLDVLESYYELHGMTGPDEAEKLEFSKEVREILRRYGCGFEAPPFLWKLDISIQLAAPSLVVDIPIDCISDLRKLAISRNYSINIRDKSQISLSIRSSGNWSVADSEGATPFGYHPETAGRE